MAQQVIGVGIAANDGLGDPLRTAMIKINDNFSEIYGQDAIGSNFDLTQNTISTINTNGNIVLDPNGSGQVIINDDSVTVAVSRTPLHSTGSPGDKQGMIAWDSNYLYICTADYSGSHIWKRVFITGTW